MEIDNKTADEVRKTLDTRIKKIYESRIVHDKDDPHRYHALCGCSVLNTCSTTGPSDYISHYGECEYKKLTDLRRSLMTPEEIRLQKLDRARSMVQLVDEHLPKAEQEVVDAQEKVARIKANRDEALQKIAELESPPI